MNVSVPWIIHSLPFFLALQYLSSPFYYPSISSLISGHKCHVLFNTFDKIKHIFLFTQGNNLSIYYLFFLSFIYFVPFCLMWLLYFFIYLFFMAAALSWFLYAQVLHRWIHHGFIPILSGPTNAFPSGSIRKVMEVGLGIVTAGDLICQPNYVKLKFQRTLPLLESIAPQEPLWSLGL